MKKNLSFPIVILIFICFLALAAPSQTQDKLSLRLQNRVSEVGKDQIQAVWIFLNDKGPDAADRQIQAEAAMLPRTRLRRLRHTGMTAPVDMFDVPVYSP